MLPTDLLMHRHNGETIIPKNLKIDAKNIALANDIISCFQAAQGTTQGELDRQLLELEGDSIDFRVKRGLSHLLKSESFSKFEIISPLDPQELRQRVFSLASQTLPSHQATQQTLS